MASAVLNSPDSQEQIAARIEHVIRTAFQVAENDQRFSRTRLLFDEGYVDSIGFVELLGFLDEEFGVSIPDDILMSDEFTTIDGIANVVWRQRASARSPSSP